MRDDSPVHQRAEAHVRSRIAIQPDGCWLWTGSVHTSGYGVARFDGNVYQAHRFAYEALIGPIPLGHSVHHRCQVKRCVNPSHLQALTPSQHSAHHGSEKRDSVVGARLAELKALATR